MGDGYEPPVEPTQRYGPPYPPAGPVWPPASTQGWSPPSQAGPPALPPSPPSGPPAGPASGPPYGPPSGPPYGPTRPIGYIPGQAPPPATERWPGPAGDPWAAQVPGRPAGWSPPYPPPFGPTGGLPPGPHAGPWTGYGPYWPPQPPPPRRSPAVWAVAGVVLIILVAFVGVVFARAVRGTGTNDPAWAGRSGGGIGGAASGMAAPSDPVPSTTAGTITNADALAEKVDPAIVDVNVTLRQGRAAGTGIVLTGDGLVLTNNHVIDGGQTVSAVDYGDGNTYQAEVLGYDRSRDLALLQLQHASGLKTATIGDSGKVKVGDPVLALGNAGGRGGRPAAAPGTVTALDRTITASDENGTNAERLSGLIQVAAAIEAGDSGGPLVNSSAQVIGIDTAAAADAKAQASGGIGFAIPINQAMTVAHQIQTRTGPATVHTGPTAFLGVVLGTTSGDSNDVASVAANSPASRAGIVQGDQITTVDGASIGSSSDLADALVPHHPNDQVTVTWKKANGQSRSARVTLGQGAPL